MQIQGTFDIRMQAEPPYDDVDGVSLGRVQFDKQFHGPLTATSVVQMLGARTPDPAVAGYVALERITGTLEDRSGTVVVMHRGLMGGGQLDLSLTLLPGSGTGGWKGLTGSMRIEIVEGHHHYHRDYSFDNALPD